MDNIFCKFEESMNNSESFFGGVVRFTNFRNYLPLQTNIIELKGSQLLQISFKKENQKSLLIALLKVR
jgi:hypothetical protein